MSHLKNFGVGNFKVFKELTHFDLAPITILTGKNNSGKSSLIKSLLLLQNSFAEDTITFEKIEKSKGHSVSDNLKIQHLKFDRSELKLGSPDQILNFEQKSKILTFELSVNNSTFPNGRISLEYMVAENNEMCQLVAFKIFNDKESVVEYKSALKDKLMESTQTKLSEYIKVDFQYFLNRIEVPVPDSLNLKSDHLEKETGQYSDGLCVPSKKLDGTDLVILGIDELYNEYDKEYDEWHTGLTGKKIDLPKEDLLKIQNQLFEELKNGSILEEMYDLRNCLGSFEQTYYQTYHQITDTIISNIHPELSGYPNFSLFFDYAKYYILAVFGELQNEFKNVTYFPSIRARNERLYLVSKEGYAIQEIDHKAYREIDWKNEIIDQFYREALKDFEIGEEIEIKTYQWTATEITILRDNKRILLSDLGFGYAQLIPIIFKILTTASACNDWRRKYFKKKLRHDYQIMDMPKILIEEPESNLHPDFQSKLADLFIKASNLFGIQFIIETHSEYLIRRLQYLTAKKDIKPEDISIYYFNNPERIPQGEKQINKIEIRADGILKQDFGSGFYDQAANSTFDLFRLIGDN